MRYRAAAVFEGISLAIGYKQFNKVRRQRPFWQTVRESKDPTTFVVVFEDGAAMLGLLVAFLGIWLGEKLGLPMLEGVASILIGVILAAVAFLFGRECRSLLVGEGADKEMLQRIEESACQDSRIQRVADPLTMYFGPHNIMLALSVEFSDDLSADGIEAAVDELEARIRGEFSDVKRIFVGGGVVAGAAGFLSGGEWAACGRAGGQWLVASSVFSSGCSVLGFGSVGLRSRSSGSGT